MDIATHTKNILLPSPEAQRLNQARLGSAPLKKIMNNKISACLL